MAEGDIVEGSPTCTSIQVEVHNDIDYIYIIYDNEDNFIISCVGVVGKSA